mgnify:CR=1 FL=1
MRLHGKIARTREVHGRKAIRLTCSARTKTSASLLAKTCARPLSAASSGSCKQCGTMSVRSCQTMASGVCSKQRVAFGLLHGVLPNRVYTSGGSWTTQCMTAKDWSDGRMSATLCCTNNCSMPLLQVTLLHNNRILIFCL